MAALCGRCLVTAGEQNCFSSHFLVTSAAAVRKVSEEHMLPVFLVQPVRSWGVMEEGAEVLRSTSSVVFG